MKQLRWYQEECVEAIWKNLDRHIAAAVPTGGGKSLIIAELCKRATVMYPDTRICILAPRRELIEQNYEELIELYPEAPASIFCAGLNKKNINQITIASIQSIYKHNCDVTGFYDVIIADEAHLIPHGNDGMFHEFFNQQPQAKICGLTATPYRLDGGYIHKGDGALFSDLVYNCNIRRLVKEGFLCNIRPFKGSKCADMSNVHTIAGDYKQSEMQEAFNDTITRAAVNDAVSKLADRRKVLVFAAGVEHGKMIANQLSQIGTVVTVFDETSSDDRYKAVEMFRAGQVKYLVNCGVFTTGFNVPDVDAILLLRATKSPGLYVQMAGRGLRISQGKTDCLLLDYGGNVQRHGTIDDVSVIKMGRIEQKRTWTCPTCMTENSYSQEACQFCGYSRIKVVRDFEAGLEISAAEVEIIGSEIKTVQVNFAKHSPYKAKSGKTIIRVEYFKGETEMERIWEKNEFTEFICAGYPGFAGRKAQKWLERRGVVLKGGETIQEICDGLNNNCVFPKQIFLMKGTNDKYYHAVNYKF